MRSCANQCYLCVVFLETQPHFLGAGAPGRFFAGNAIFGYVPPTFKKKVSPKIDFSNFSGYFCPVWSHFLVICLISLYIPFTIIKENQANCQKMRPNRTKVVRKIRKINFRTNFFLKVGGTYPNIAFPARKRPGAPAPKKWGWVSKKQSKTTHKKHWLA